MLMLIPDFVIHYARMSSSDSDLKFNQGYITSPTYKKVVSQKYNFSGEPKNIFKGSLSNEFVIFQNVVTPGVRTIKP